VAEVDRRDADSPQRAANSYHRLARRSPARGFVQTSAGDAGRPTRPEEHCVGAAAAAHGPAARAPSEAMATKKIRTRVTGRPGSCDFVRRSIADCLSAVVGTWALESPRGSRAPLS